MKTTVLESMRTLLYFRLDTLCARQALHVLITIDPNMQTKQAN